MVGDLIYSFSQRPRSPMPKPSRRTALTPPTVIPPSLSADTPAATKPVQAAGSHSRASSMLARVVSTPSSPKQSSPTNPLPSPEESPPIGRHYSTSSMSSEKGSPRPQIVRFATMPAYSQQNGGYVSFPDFDLICQEHKTFPDSPEQQDPRSDKT